MEKGRRFIIAGLVIVFFSAAQPLGGAEEGFYVIPFKQSTTELDQRYINAEGDTMNGSLHVITSYGYCAPDPTYCPAVYAYSQYANGTGITGIGAGKGVHGEATGSSGIGVKGVAPSTGLAGYFVGPFRVDGPTTLNGAATINGSITVASGNNIYMPSNSSIMNESGKPVFHTGWTGVFGDYTDIKSGYDWGSGEPVAVVAGANGMFVTKGDASGNPHAVTLMRVDTDGKLVCEVLQILGGADLSEKFNVRQASGDSPPSPGMIVSIDPARPGGLIVSQRAYDHKVAGVISGAGGVNPGLLISQKGSEADGASPVALSGRVYCWADASPGAIEPGDILTSSDVPGHAMKATDHEKTHGAVLGKAMSPLKSGKGLVLVLVNLQ
jgi:hypothetical protein